MSGLLGAGVAAASAGLYDVGYILEKRALIGLPPIEMRPRAIFGLAARSPLWAAGFATMLGGLGLQVLALTLAPVSVVQPILAGGLIALAAAGSAVLGERLDNRHRMALLLILAAVVAVAASARGGDDLAVTVSAGRFAAAAGVGLLVVGVLMGLVPGGRRRGLLNTACAAGTLYGLGAVAEKAVATRLHSAGLLWGALHALAGPYPWVFVAATAAGMVVFQAGLQAHPASLMASLTNGTSTVCALAGAALLFGEGVLPGGWWSVARLAGFAAAAAAVVLVAAPGRAVGREEHAGPAVAP